MNTNKTSNLIIAFLLAIVSLQATNPNANRANEMVRKTVERLTEIVGLDPSQQILLTEKVRNHFAKVQMIEESQDERLMIAEIKKASEDFRASMDSILTVDQKTKLAAKKEAVRVAIAEKNKDKKRSQTNNK